MNNRRKLLLGLGAGALAAPFRSLAQTQKVHRVGILFGGSTLRTGRVTREFQEELGRLGYIEGQNLAIIQRQADLRLERLPALAAELVAEHVDVILATSTMQVQAARQATSSIPIVFVLVTDPVGMGFVQSLARPGFNMTGTTNVNIELSGKRLEILKELAPKASRVAVLVSDEPNVPIQVEQIRIGAKQLGITIQTTQVSRREDFEAVGKQLRAWRTDALLAVESTANNYNAKLLGEFAAHVRLPAIYVRGNYIDEGGLISYGANAAALYRRAAHFVDRILKGAKPADLPVELPTHYEMVINMKAARSLGIKVPQSLLLRADRVIE